MSTSESQVMGFCGSKVNAMSVKDGVIQNECFVDVLNIVPHALLTLTCTFILTAWNHSVIGKLKVKTWVHFQGHSFRWVCTLALITTIMVEIAEGFISDFNDPDTTNYHAFIPACMAFLGAVLSIAFYHNVEQWNSPRFLLLLLMYWPIALVLKCLKALSMYKNHLPLDLLKVWLSLLDPALYLLLFLIELNVLRCQRYAFFKKRHRLRPPADLENTRYLQSYVNFVSQAVYWWVTDLLIKGFKQALTLKDLGKLPQSEKSSRVYRKLQMIFKEEKFKAAQRHRQPSLMYSLFRASWRMLLLSAVYRLLGDLLSFVAPVLIELIVNYAYERNDWRLLVPSGNDTRSSKPLMFVTVSQFFWNGYVLSVFLFLALVLQHTLLQNHHFIVIREGIRVRTGVQAMVYSKALKISTLELKNGTAAVAQIVNHMSINSTFLMFFFFFAHYIWAVPVQVGLTLLLMYMKLGLAGVIGGCVAICTVPVMFLLGLVVSRTQKKILVYSDKRAKKLSELVQGIEVIKLMSWETGFVNWVEETRSVELSHLLPNTLTKAVISFLGISAPVVGTLVTFVLYPVFEDTPLRAGPSLAVLALFSFLQGPLQTMSLLFSAIIHAHLSSQRLLAFLLATEVAEPLDSSPSLTKSCSCGLDSAAASCHNMVEKPESVTSVDVKNPTQVEMLELQTLEKDRPRRSSVSSFASIKLSTQQHHKAYSRQTSDTLKDASCGSFSLSTSGGSVGFLESKRKDLSRNAASSELLDVRPSAALMRKSSAPTIAGVSEIIGDHRRRRHFSQWSMEEDEAILEDSILEQHYAIEVQGGSFTWDLTREVMTLRDICVRIPAGKLTVIVGDAGSGKSSLLSTFLGEMMQVSGSMYTTRNLTIAYVSQRPWLLSASVKENILFGKPFASKRYRHVVAACALQPDIDQLPAGDNTQVGEQGYPLTDGQKQQICIARALYSEAEAVLLDAPLLALDSHTSKHIVDEVILRRMIKRNRTVVLATQQVQYLSHAHQVIVLADGHVHFQGKVWEVKKFDPDLYDSWRKVLRDVKASELRTSSLQNVERKHSGGSQVGPARTSSLQNVERKHSGGSQVGPDTLSRPSSTQSQLSLLGLPMSGRKISSMSVMSEASNEDAIDDGLNITANGEHKMSAGPVDSDVLEEKLLKPEMRETGAVHTSIYLQYFQACSITLCLMSLFLQALNHSLIVSSNWWLAMWVSDSHVIFRNISGFSSMLDNTTVSLEFDNTAYMMVFVYLCMAAVLASFAACLIIYLAGYMGCKHLFSNMLLTVVHLPLRLFDTSPVGRILHRFSSDTLAIDQRLGGHMENLTRCWMWTLSAVVVNAVTTPYFLCAAVPFFIAFYFLQRFFRTTARELQRLDGLSKSVLLSHVSETLQGLTVIRAFGAPTEYKRRAFRMIDANVTPFLFIHTINRWLGMRLDLMSCMLVFISSVLGLSSSLHGWAHPALIGLSITYTLMVSGQLNWIVRISTEVELSMKAVERVLENTHVDTEPSISSSVGSVAVAESWPQAGEIEFSQVSLHYGSDQEAVLSDVSLVISAGQHVGVCGRPRSGKTSLVLALFRLLHISDGSIFISGLDITRVDLVTLRSRLAIVPHESILFSGTLRFNLDANQKRSDEKLWSVLEVVHLKDCVLGLPHQLDTDIGGGEMFDSSQRQLLSLARALLSDSKILVLDDITAVANQETVTLIQTIIDSQVMAKITIITVSGQPSLLMDCDKVVVLEAGKVKECAAPADLLADEASAFYSLVHSQSVH